MKKIFIAFLLFSVTAFSQQNYNIKKGFIANGYDIVTYFEGKPEKGSKKFTTVFDGVKFKFSSAKNLNLFIKHPKKYIPQFGGYCAYAIGKSGDKVSVNPKTFEIREGKLYLFYNAWGTNTLELWIKEGANQLKQQAELNWKKLQKEK